MADATVRQLAPPRLPLPAARWLLLALLAANLLPGLATLGLIDQDESAYAGLARSAAREGNWLAPSFPYAEPHRKPPLLIWLIAAADRLVGVGELATRLPSVFALLLTATALWRGGQAIVGAGTARLATLLLLSMPFVLGVHRVGLTDGVLLTCQTVAALALLNGLTRLTRGSVVLLWTAVALGVLAKGPVILVLIGGMFGALALVRRFRRRLALLHPLLGLPLALLPTIAWALAALREQPEYVLFLLDWYGVRRLGGGVFGQVGPPGYHFLLMFLLALPWSGWLLPALRSVWRGVRRGRTRDVLLASWLAGGWLIWELPPSKLPTYALGAYPAIALILARQVRITLRAPRRVRASRAHDRSQRLAALIAAGFSLAVAIGGAWVADGPLRKALAVLGGLAFFAAAGAAMRAWERRDVPAMVRRCLFGALVANAALWLLVMPALESQRSFMARVVNAIAQHHPPGAAHVGALPGIGPSAPAAQTMPGAAATADGAGARRITIVTDGFPPYASLPFYALEAGFQFENARAAAAPTVEIPWSLLPALRLRDFASGVRSQRPAVPTGSAARQMALARIVARLRASGADWPAPDDWVLVLGSLSIDEVRAALRAASLPGSRWSDGDAAVDSRLADAEVLTIRGWRLDAGRFVELRVVIPWRSPAVAPLGQGR